MVVFLIKLASWKTISYLTIEKTWRIIRNYFASYLVIWHTVCPTFILFSALIAGILIWQPYGALTRSVGVNQNSHVANCKNQNDELEDVDQRRTAEPVDNL